MTKREIEKEIENLKLLIEFHTTNPVIKNPREREEHTNAILDRLSELIKERDKKE